MCNWREEEDYEFCRDLTPQLWAWQFLRRHPEYHKDYEWFITLWRALEADYGKPPDRDFTRWKNDPRAWAPEHMTADLCEEDKHCASPDGDRVLIECAMGAKWGFYKFPVAPDVALAKVPDQLLWREIDVKPLLVENPEDIQQDESIVTLSFNLAWPLKPQLESGQRQLRGMKAKFQRTAQSYTPENLKRFIRLLDAKKENADIEEIITELYGGDDEMYHDDIVLVTALLSGDYRYLAFTGN
ncbi:MAG: hypothetical protein EP297_10865 [Gammaproteobacteria bacterium]|nr:MAG: hypothetical protein EP297_10865 [Gammaproteobacteria bacterium]